MFAVLFCPRWRPSDVSVLLDAACAHVRVHSVLHLGALSLLHQTGQNKMSTEYCHNKIAVVCFHINSLQSQQAFCFFLGLRAVWVVPFMQLWPNQARLTRCLSEYIYIHPEMDKSHIGGVLHPGRSSWSWSGCLMSAKGFFFFCYLWCLLRQNFIHRAQHKKFKSLLWKLYLMNVYLFCVQCYYGCYVYLMADFTSPNDSSDWTGPFSHMFKVKWTHI